MGVYGRAAFYLRHGPRSTFAEMAAATKKPGDDLRNSPSPLTRHSPYRRDKLSRLAPPSESIVCRSHHGIRSLAEGSPHGAHVAGQLALV